MSSTMNASGRSCDIPDAARYDIGREESYRLLLDELPVGVIQIGEDEKIRFVNLRFANMLGYTPQSFPGTIKDLIDPDIHFHSQHTWKDMWYTMRQFRVGIRFRHKNGHDIPTENIIRLIPDDKGAPDFAIIVSRPADPDGKPVPEQHLSLFDPLTSLPNRNYLDSFLDGAIKRTCQNGKMLCVLELNINRFKIINESLGYDAGDALLKQVSKRLIHAVHENDTVIRLGGDEFIVILENIGRMEDIACIADRLMKTVTEPLRLSGHNLSIGISIGGSLYPHDAADTGTLLKHADIALAEARRKRSSVVRFYSPGMDITPKERLITESRLRQALEKNEFVLFYQPRLSLKTGDIAGLEALIRWNHPEEGIVPASTFISVAEEIGLIGKIGETVLNTITRQLLAWREKGIVPIPIAFNVSTRELYSTHLPESLKRIMIETGLSPHLFELEITESSLIEDMDEVHANLTAIRQMGISIAIDDFGTGYSSLRYLSSLPIDFLKIDSSFIAGLTTSNGMKSIIESTIAMAHSLHMPVIAEGVSTQEQLEFLIAQNCDQIQGYLCSPPLSSDELEIFLNKRHPRKAFPKQP